MESKCVVELFAAPQVMNEQCLCPFECYCEQLEQIIGEWISSTDRRLLEDKLSSVSDPLEYFSRLCCVLFYSDIIADQPSKTSAENTQKIYIAWQYAVRYRTSENAVLPLAACIPYMKSLRNVLSEKLKSYPCRMYLPPQCFIIEAFAVKFEDEPQTNFTTPRRSVTDRTEIPMASNSLRIEEQLVVTEPENISKQDFCELPSYENDEEQENRAETLDHNEDLDEIQPLPKDIETATERRKRLPAKKLSGFYIPLHLTRKRLNGRRHGGTSSHMPLKPSACLKKAMRPFPCPVLDCPQAFNAKWALDRHYVTHTGEMPHECTLCPMKFNKAGLLKLHFSQQHRNATPLTSRKTN